jgi:uncharacterized lipoprotein
MRLIETIGAALALGALAGCHWSKPDPCHEHQPYESAASVAPLRAAEGLPAANTKNALKIPDAAEGKPRQPTDACLDRPPSFYADRPRPTVKKK